MSGAAETTAQDGRDWVLPETRTAMPKAPKPAEMMHLAKRSDAEGLKRLAIHAALLLGAGALIAWAPGWWKLPALLPMALVQAALFAPLHETVHYTAFASRRLNAIVGWVAGAPSLWNWHLYQQFHMDHHKYTQIEGKDPELAPPSPHELGGYIQRMFGLTFWKARLKHNWAGLKGDLSAYPYVHPAAAPRVSRSIRAMDATLAVCAIGSALIWGWQTPFLFWILPQLIGQNMLRFYLITEHTGCSMDRNGLTNTRTTLTHPLVRLLMWNMPYHAEHHLYPFVPFHRLAEAHAVLKEKLAFVQPGYAAWHRDHLRRLRGGAA
ncbi:fatty acid desaturase [Siccirubricoccus phaeus]|uniref:fatty acid desaturase n=1 Tax=Siccirubricoccus phaeus TaxID=2595053 RepID=UPI0011F3E566|nr:fatty acid desaturase [Siccirubricoccus phaeus]